MSSREVNPYEPSLPFERFSDDIRHALQLANREAKWRFAAKIDTPHLLTGIALEPTGLGGNLLRRHHVTATAVRRHSRRMLSGPQYVTLFGKLPLASNTQSVISGAIEWAIIEKHNSVGTGGVLLTMLKADDKTATIMTQLGIVVDELKQELALYLHRFMVEAPDVILHLDPIVSDDV